MIENITFEERSSTMNAEFEESKPLNLDLDPTTAFAVQLLDKVKADNDETEANIAEMLEGIDPTANANTANAFKATASGEIVRVDDVSPIEHIAKAKISGKNLISNDFYDLAKWHEHGNTTQYTFQIDIAEGTYTLSGTVDNVVDKYFYIQKSNDDFATIITTYIITPSQNQMPYTFEADSKYKYRFFWYGNAFEELQNIMLEEGAEATEYEPYIDPATVTLTRCNRSIFSKKAK